jgi:hypothetical protein
MIKGRAVKKKQTIVLLPMYGSKFETAHIYGEHVSSAKIWCVFIPAVATPAANFRRKHLEYSFVLV